MRRILCLHGYRQNAQVFKDKTGSLRKLLKKHAELVYISAPHIIPQIASSANAPSGEDMIAENVNVNTNTEEKLLEQRGWYFSKEELTFNSHDITDFSWGLEDSLEVIRKAFEEMGPFDGILGFSQGACLGSMLCYMLENGELSYSFKFAILVSGFRSRLSPHVAYFSSKRITPSLHIIGDTDRIVEKEMCEELTEFFENPEIMHHSGGHYVPATSKEKQFYFAFLDKF